MIDLFIDSLPVYLANDITINITSRNPYLTKEGEFTLDIDISLHIPENRRVYKNIDRINNTINNKRDRPVELYIDGRLILSGTEVLISNTEESVKIQILAGNSELNYKIRDNILIRDLDLGTITYTSDSALTLNGLDDLSSFSRGDYCFPLLLVDDNGTRTLCNDITRTWIYRTEDGTIIRNDDKPEYSNLYPQLYLDFAITKLIESLGYSISKNIFSTDPLLKYVLMVSCNNSTQLNKLYPNMTVKDFLTKIEDAFSVVINIDNKSKTATIERLSDFITNASTAYIDSMDDFSIEYQDQEDIINGYQYKRGDTNYHKRMILKEDVITGRTYTGCNNFQGLLSNIQLFGGFQAVYDKNMLFKDNDTDTYYYIGKENTSLILSEVAVLTDLRSGEKKEIECVPAECLWKELLFKILDDGQFPHENNISLNIPLIYKPIMDTNQNLDDTLLNGIEKESKRDCINLMFYNGPAPIKIRRQLGMEISVSYPLSFIDYMSIYYRTQDNKWDLICNDSDKLLSLRIKKVTSIMEDHIDTSEEYKFNLLSRVHINNVFEIKNRLFIAKESVTTINNGFIKYSGIFHPVKKH